MAIATCGPPGLITDYKLSQKRSILAGEMFLTIAIVHFSGLGGTTAARRTRDRGRSWVRFPLTQCVSQLSGKPPGVNCRLWPATTPSSEL